ncbi:uncharacterized protein [Coffea arabica]|uniref:Uncharacterized protein isoform X3 n=1 Tax=Coffea arabica TaxID=13443 RepID=A0ABM4W102_COFAR
MAYQQQQPPPPVPGPGSGSSSGSGLQFLNSPFGDTTFTKVFVGGLAWETQSDTMRRYFEQFGEILEAVVITDKNTGRSKGYGFVTFRDPESARRACADPTPIIDGRRANCNLASLGRPRPALPFVCYFMLLLVTGRLRSPTPYLGGLPANRGAYVGSFGYQQPVSYGYQQGLMYSPFGSYMVSMSGRIIGMQHTVQIMSILRVFTILMGGSSTFTYMVCLGLLIQLCILTARWVRQFLGVIVMQHCRGIQCPIISLCSLGGLASML